MLAFVETIGTILILHKQVQVSVGYYFFRSVTHHTMNLNDFSASKSSEMY